MPWPVVGILALALARSWNIGLVMAMLPCHAIALVVSWPCHGLSVACLSLGFGCAMDIALTCHALSLGFALVMAMLLPRKKFDSRANRCLLGFA